MRLGDAGEGVETTRARQLPLLALLRGRLLLLLLLLLRLLLLLLRLRLRRRLWLRGFGGLLVERRECWL